MTQSFRPGLEPGLEPLGQVIEQSVFMPHIVGWNLC